MNLSVLKFKALLCQVFEERHAAWVTLFQEFADPLGLFWWARSGSSARDFDGDEVSVRP